MYIKSDENEIKQINTSVHSKITQILKNKNMDWDDVKILVSIEFTDAQTPSRSYLDFDKKMQSRSPKKVFKDLFSNISPSHSQAEALAEVEKSQLKLKQLEAEVSQIAIDSFKDMLKDKDNELRVIVKNQFIDLEENLQVSDYTQLPQSLRDRIDAGDLTY